MTETSALALVILAFVAFALVLLASLSLVPATAHKARELWPVMISELVIVAVALAFVLPGGVVTGLGVALLAARCGWEAATVVSGRDGGGQVSSFGLGTAAAGAVLLAYAGGPLGVAAGLGLALFAAIATTMLAGSSDRRGGFLLGVFPLAALVGFAAVAASPSGGAILLLAFLLVETMDSFAVLGGRLFGRRKIFPRLSPRKTVEGLLTGAVGVSVATFILGVAVMGWPLRRIVAVAVVVAVTTVAGDLVASWFKRRAGVKDYPPIHPVQGGVLDIVDAWIVTTPALALILAIA